MTKAEKVARHQERRVLTVIHRISTKGTCRIDDIVAALFGKRRPAAVIRRSLMATMARLKRRGWIGYITKRELPDDWGWGLRPEGQRVLLRGR